MSAVLAIRQARPSLVYLNTSATLLLGWPARLLGARVVLHVHESWAAREGRYLGLLGAAANDVICVSEAVRDLLPSWMRSRALVIYNGIPAPHVSMSPLAKSPQASQDTAQMVFLVASRWNAWKGHDLLLAAWACVDKNHARLIILGGPPPSGASLDVPRLVAALPNSETVTLVGETDDPGSWIAAADCVLVPSTRPDPLPTIAIEAAALGKAVLAAHIGGLPEIVSDGETGLLLPPNDKEAWVSAISLLDQVAAQHMGLAARQRYEQKFQPPMFRQKIDRLLWQCKNG